MSTGANGMDPAKVSAFAIYKNLIPGVKSYEDTDAGAVGVRSRKKNSRNRKKKNQKVKEEADLSSSSAEPNKTKKQPEVKMDPISTPSSVAKKKKKKNKKRKIAESMANGEDNLDGHETLSTPPSTPGEPMTSPEQVQVPKKKNKRIKSVESSSSETLQPPKKKKASVRMINDEEEPENFFDLDLQVAGTKRNVTSKLKQKKSAISPVTMSSISPSTPVNASRISPRSVQYLFDSEPIQDSTLHGKDVFDWLIHPMSTETFFGEHWEKKPVHLKRSSTDRDREQYTWLLTSSTLDEIMRKNCIKFGKNIDITSYIDGQRETHNPEGRALPAVVWDFYNNGNSVRFLNPQTYIKTVWRVTSSLQEYFGSFVGANVYLTPPDSQGFAPHYDDIEGFVVQLEGFKQWKLYKPRSKEEQLPRFSSKNFNEEIDKLGSPILDVVLRPGDLLYFPRGMIHQAKSIDGEHSLHITISTYQTNAYYDFLSAYLPIALEQASQDTLDLRRGLPLDYLSYMGIVHSESKDKEVVEKRNTFQKKIKKLAEGILTKSCDLAADQLGKKLVWDSLPPYFSSKEKRRSVYSDGEFIQDGTVLNRVEMGPDVHVKLVRKHACRLLLEEGSLRLYFNLQNSMEYHGEEPAYIELPDRAGPAVEFLFSTYPEFTSVEDIPLEDEELKVQLCADLWEKGILLTRNPLSSYPFDETVGSEDEMEDPSDSSSSEEDVSVEEEEDEEDREFIDDHEGEDEESGGENVEDFINDEASEDDDNMGDFINDEPSEEEESDDDDDSPPLLVNRRNNSQTGKSKIVGKFVTYK